MCLLGYLQIFHGPNSYSPCSKERRRSVILASTCLSPTTCLALVVHSTGALRLMPPPSFVLLLLVLCWVQLVEVALGQGIVFPVTCVGHLIALAAEATEVVRSTALRLVTLINSR